MATEDRVKAIVGESVFVIWFHASRRYGRPLGRLERRVHPATTLGPAWGRGIVTTTILVIVQQFPLHAGFLNPPPP